MNIYQKAIKLRKECESKENCNDCNYFINCKNSNIIYYIPSDESIEKLSKAIKIEKWNVK